MNGIEEKVFNEQVVRELLCRITPFQMLILHLVAIGKFYREIGDMIGTTGANVKYHIREIRRIARSISEE